MLDTGGSELMTLARYRLTMIASGLAAILVGCAPNKQIGVTSDPPGAEVFIDGGRAGRTPLTIETDDLMPSRAADGKVSARAVLTFAKPGYEEYRLVLREWGIPDQITATLVAVGIAEHFENYLDQNPELEGATVASLTPAAIKSSEDLDSDGARLFSEGYVLVAYAGFSAEGIALESIEEQARKIGAALVLVQSKFAGVATELRPVTTRTPPTVAPSFSSGHLTATQAGWGQLSSYGAGGVATASGSYSGVSSAFYSATGFTILPGQTHVNFVPFAKREYENQVTFWRQRHASLLGAYCDYVPEALRSELQRNTGAFVVALQAGGPAFLADVLVGDVIVSADDLPVRTPADVETIARMARGHSVKLGIIRAGKTLTVEAPIAYGESDAQH